MKTTRKLMVILAMLWASTWAANAAVVLSGPGVTEDNTLFSAPHNDANYGNGVDSNVGEAFGITRRSLLRFDLSSLAGQTVTSASLQLTLRLTEGTYANLPLNLYLIFASNAGWVEGTDATLSHQAGSSDWDYAVDNTAPWRDSGGTGNFPGLGLPGDAYASTPVASFTVNSTDPVNVATTITFSNLAFLQNWINNPSQNAGFLLASPDYLEASGGSWRWYQSENSTAAFQPILTLELAVPEPSMILLLATGGLLLWRRTKRQ